MPPDDRSPQSERAAEPQVLTAEGFAEQLQASFRILWLVAVGVVKDAALAEDVVQEAALIGLGKLADFRPGTNFRAWMAQMVRFVALNHSRKQRRRRAASLDSEHVSEPASPTRAQLALTRAGELPDEQRHFDDRILQALGEVSDTARACLLLRAIEGLEYSEISKTLSIPPGTAMSHVHRTRRFLRERLTEPDAAGRVTAHKEGRS